MIALAFFLLFIIFCLGVVCYGRRNYGMLENGGFPVIPPTLFLGSDPTFYRKVVQLEDLKRFKKYGPIWGLYLGAQPQVIISDPELIRLIFVKESDYFYNRREVDFGSPLLNQATDFLPGEKWKTIRSMLSPLFTTTKLKTMTNVMTAHAQEYVGDLSRECSQQNGRIKYDCKLRLTSCLIDMFAQSTLGIQLENRKDPNNKFAVAFKKLIGEDIVYGPLYSLTTVFPFLTKFAPMLDDSHTDLIVSTIRHIMQTRRDTSTKSNDFIDVLNEIMAKVGSVEFQKLGITELTVIAQAVNFIIGGYETSSTTISHFFYFMAKNPAIQEKLYEEIFSKFGSDESKTTHDTIKDENTTYLTACLNESIRFGPPLRAERICTKDWSHGDIRIKKGTEINIAMFAAQRNPEIFLEPDHYKPERFLPENKAAINPYAFVAFGHGPRNCIGMRFAYDSIRTFLIHFILNFKIELRPDTILDYKKGTSVFLLIEPLYVDVVKRVQRE